MAAAKAAAAGPPAESESKDGEPSADGHPDEDTVDDESGEDVEAQEAQPNAADGAGAAPAAAGGLQTFVFSATLTLPLALRRRLQKRASFCLMSRKSC